VIDFYCGEGNGFKCPLCAIRVILRCGKTAHDSIVWSANDGDLIAPRSLYYPHPGVAVSLSSVIYRTEAFCDGGLAGGGSVSQWEYAKG